MHPLVLFFNPAIEQIYKRHNFSEKDRKMHIPEKKLKSLALILIVWPRSGLRSCVGHDVSCKAFSSWKPEVLSQEYAVLRYVLIGALQDDVYLHIFTSWCVLARQCGTYLYCYNCAICKWNQGKWPFQPRFEPHHSTLAFCQAIFNFEDSLLHITTLPLLHVTTVLITTYYYIHECLQPILRLITA